MPIRSTSGGSPPSSTYGMQPPKNTPENGNCVVVEYLLPDVHPRWRVVPCDQRENMGVVCIKPSRIKTSDKVRVFLRATASHSVSCSGSMVLLNNVCVGFETVLLSEHTWLKNITENDFQDVEDKNIDGRLKNFVYLLNEYLQLPCFQMGDNLPTGIIYRKTINTRRENCALLYDPSLPEWTVEELNEAKCLDRLVQIHGREPIVAEHKNNSAYWYYCNTGEIISNAFICDGVADCSDFSDELQCPPTCNMTGLCDTCTWWTCECSAFTFHCFTGGCIPALSLCDGVEHCQDGSDEIYCPTSRTGESVHKKSKCSSLICKSTNTCVPESEMNNLQPLCDDGEDEPIFIDWWKKEAAKRDADSDVHNLGSECSPYQLPCLPRSSLCFSLDNLCIYNRNVEDGLLSACPNGGHLRSCQHFICPDSMYKCHESYCIPVSLLCDGIKQCPKGEDERLRDCSPGTQSYCPGLLKCRGASNCVHPNQIGDGIVHCKLHQDDELFQRSCPVTCQCRGDVIHCANNHLEHVPHTAFFATSLNLRHNLIILQPSSFSRFSRLLLLVLSNNFIHSLANSHFEPVTNLISLDLSFNNIEVVPQGAFQTLHYLARLLLNNNRIHIFGSFLFKPGARLVFLRLDSNHVSKAAKVLIEPDAFIGSQIVMFYAGIIAIEIAPICCGHSQIRNCSYSFDGVEIVSNVNCGGVIISNMAISAWAWLTGSTFGMGNILALLKLIGERNKDMSKVDSFHIGPVLCSILNSLYLVGICATDAYYRIASGLQVAQWRSSLPCVIMKTLSASSYVVYMYLCAVDLVRTAMLLDFSAKRDKNKLVKNFKLLLWIGSALLVICICLVATNTLDITKDKGGLCHMLTSLGNSLWANIMTVFITVGSLLILFLCPYIVFLLTTTRRKAKRTQFTSAEIRLFRKLASILIYYSIVNTFLYFTIGIHKVDTDVYFAVLNEILVFVILPINSVVYLIVLISVL